MKPNLKCLGIFLLVAGVGILQAQENWPQWRGQGLDNISTAKDLPVEFRPEKNLVWKREMPGPGGSSPVVWDDRVFVTSVVEKDDSLELLCLDRMGDLIWARTLRGENRNLRMDQANSASASPCTDGTHVWATTAAGFLQCFDWQGQEVWSVDLQDRYGEFDIQFGMSSTPILHEGVLYLQLIHGSMRDRNTTSEGTVAAIEAGSGNEIWTQTRKTDGHSENKHSYASPTLVQDGDREFLVTHGGDYVMGHSLKDGSELWRCGGLNPPGPDYNPYLRFVASPVFSDGKLIVPSAKNGPVICLKTDLSGDVTDDADALQWRIQQGTPDVATPVMHGGLVFLARENGVMLCLRAETGEKVYEKRLFADKHRSTPVVAEDRIYLVSRQGNVLVISADEEGRLLSESELGEEAKSSPAIVNGRVYVRTNQALYCFGS